MESQGLRSFSNPKAMLSSLLSKREQLQDQLRHLEKTLYELETGYLQDTTVFGNAMKGFDGFLSSSKNSSNLKRSRKFQLEDRVFSLSSVTSPASEELRVGKEDGKSDMVQGRPRVGGVATAGPGKPKKGRTGQREVKRMRLSSDLDPEEDDDLDLR